MGTSPMANTTVNISAQLSDVSRIRNPFIAIVNALVRVAERNPQMQRVQALAELSDAQLAERGLERQDIVRHVFGDRFWL